jgi:hypothetical protein
MKKILLAIFFIFICALKSFSIDYYVSPSGVNDNTTNRGSLALPFRTIQYAADRTNPGDNIFIMNGTYSSTNGPLLTISRNGTASNYITFKPYAGHSPLLKASGNVWNAVLINADYILFEGLELEGNNANLTLADAQTSYNQSKTSSPTFNANFNTNAISIGESGANGVDIVHHVIVRNCKVHDFPAAGIGMRYADYVTIENNLVYNNSWFTMYATSGISVLGPSPIDNVTTYKIIIRNNISYGNKTQIFWRRSQFGVDVLSDGNGIIVDANNGRQGTSSYPGRTLVANNVSYNNGGSGIHAYQVDRVDIINNTAFNNGVIVGYAEIYGQDCSDVKIYNNIMFARSGGNCNANDNGAIYDNNLYFNGPSFRNGPNDKTGDPRFVNRTLDGTANFQLMNTSPAINNGSTVPTQFTSTDILGVARPIGFASDMGAYEYPIVVSRPEMLVKQGTTDISDNTGSFDFGDVSSTVPKVETFTIQNIGDLVLNLSGTPRVSVTGTGFSLQADAPTSVSASNSATFQIRFAPSSVGLVNGTISIANNDDDENPYNFAITGYGYDGTKALQTITFNELPLKVVNNADFNPGASSSAGLPITYSSSNTNIATIVSGQIRLVSAGTTTITASQVGNGTTNPAKNVSQILTVTPVIPAPGTNMILNPTFNANTTGWSFAYRNEPASATITSVAISGSTTNVGKVTPTNLGTTTGIDNIQLSTRVFLVKDKTYQISFKASADAPRNITLRLLQDVSPFSTLYTISNIALTTTQANYGIYTYTSSFTGYVALRFFVATNNIPTYFDDVVMIEEVPSTLPIGLLSFNASLKGNDVLLKWKTSSEVNAQEFQIENSIDVDNFYEIGKVKAMNIANGYSYNYTHFNVPKGVSYYRLKNVDQDGTFKYSNIVFISNSLPKEDDFIIYPNPVVDMVNLKYPIVNNNATLTLVNINGNKLAVYNLAAGSNQTTIDFSELSKGYYILIFANGDKNIVKSFIK